MMVMDSSLENTEQSTSSCGSGDVAPGPPEPLLVPDLWSEEENEDYEEDKEENEDEVDAKQDFRCLCSRCHEEINWFHRYYYSCSTCSDFSIHKFCAELPDRLEDICEVGHTLGFYLFNDDWWCDICDKLGKPGELLYRCDICDFKVDANCATKALQKNIIHHPSHRHPLVRIPRQFLGECDACGEEHKGLFYHCPTCPSSYFIHSDCAFLPKKLQIQHTTNDIFSHIHPLTLAYSFPKTDQESKRYPRCRVCRHGFSSSSHLWLYKCEKCRYYTHLDCATSPDKMIKNYDDVEHPDLLHLPFPDPSYSLLKHLFFKESGTETHEVSHQHPLILEDSRISYHDPTKRIETLCNGCLRPITSGPVYVCSNEEGDEHCNFVLHEWCSRLPTELKDHPRHPRHPLILHSKVIDLWSEEENEDYEEDKEENEDEVDAKQDFRCLCSRCHEEINWFHRYYYSCSTCSDFSIHKFCAELPDRLEDICEVGHTLGFYLFNDDWWCDICDKLGKPGELLYRCDICDFKVDANCATKALQKNIIHHPSHRHPLVRIPRQFLGECDACGEEHKGLFYHCPTCPSSYFIHSDCAFLPKKLQIQHTTNDIFSHIHPLTLAYSFPKTDQESKRYPRCRVCRHGFSSSSHLWLYKCEKCRYYTHLDCATSPDKMIKNYDDVEHPDLLHLPFPDPSYSLLKHLFFKESGTETHEVSHQHPLILEDSRISYHDPTKRIETLCNGCLRPITSGPVYVCSNEEGDEHCNFVLHEWCSRLPTELKDHPRHPRHPLILHSKVIGKFFGVFACDLCGLYCNGFAYCCVKCDYYMDVNCAFVPKEITHNSHPNHLLTLNSSRRSFICHTCDYFEIPLRKALLIPETTTHKCDKHPMKLSYFPIENHMGDYFCEICEEEFDPESTFYHCRECMQSIHTACAPSILRYETYAKCGRYGHDVNEYINVKFGGTYNNIEVHPHPLSFDQGVESDGLCHKDGWRSLHFKMIFKCLTCEFVICYDCMKRLCFLIK
ncbi:putative chromatin regulator PHD family [Helianthus annuus]|nr:putative chromatin regulator PHD family [Helianthus annuus]KAJ0552067.1 putative chromatin regulator PHD family [Helianthus annuus]